MAALVQPRRRFALDTNVLIDLGAELPFAQRFLATFRTSGLAISPTVVQELVAIASSSKPAAKHAAIALTNVRRWEILPYDLLAVGHGITEVNARKLMDSGLLPDEEFNDGLIVIETALACIPSLVSSDNHLLKINQAQLTQKLDEFHLPPVNIFHPRDLLR
jgi:predicted nucleic acid-binding protein